MQKLHLEQLPELVLALSEKIEHLEKAVLSIADTATFRPQEETLMTINEASGFLHLTKNTLYSLVSKSKIPVCKRGKRLYFRKNELIEWINDGRRNASSEIINQTEDYLGSSYSSVKRRANHV